MLEPTNTDKKNSPVAEERRASPRHRLQVGIGLHSESQIFVGYSEDFSDGGVFVSTFERLDVGSSVVLDIDLPTGTRVTCPGRVAWVRPGSEIHPPGLGIAFGELTTEGREAILAFTREHAPLFYDLEEVGDG